MTARRRGRVGEPVHVDVSTAQARSEALGHMTLASGDPSCDADQDVPTNLLLERDLDVHGYEPRDIDPHLDETLDHARGDLAQILTSRLELEVTLEAR